MSLPDNIPMTCTLFGDMSKGGYLRAYRNDEFGIDAVVTAKTRREEPVTKYSIDRLPDKVFDSIEELREAVANIGDDDGSGERSEGNEDQDGGADPEREAT